MNANFNIDDLFLIEYFSIFKNVTLCPNVFNNKGRNPHLKGFLNEKYKITFPVTLAIQILL